MLVTRVDSDEHGRRNGLPARAAKERLVTTTRTPTHREALWELESAFDRGALVTVFGPCTVEYEGRAASSLSEGRRLLVLKPDGTALVHTDEGREPVNWQPPGCQHRVAVRDGRLRVTSRRSSPAEELRVAFSRVEQVTAYEVTGARGVAVTGTESDLCEKLLAEPSLIEDGFEPLERERPTTAGAIDLFGRDEDGRPVAVELKRRRVGPDAVGQLGRYVTALEREEGLSDPRGVLVSPSVTERARELLSEEGLAHVAVEPPTPDEVAAMEDGASDESDGDSRESDGDSRESDSNSGEADEASEDGTDAPPVIVNDPADGDGPVTEGPTADSIEETSSKGAASESAESSGESES